MRSDIPYASSTMLTIAPPTYELLLSLLLTVFLTVLPSHRTVLLTVFCSHQVINNAGIVSRGQFVDTPVSEARKLLEVNYLGAYMVTQVSTGTGLMQR